MRDYEYSINEAKKEIKDSVKVYLRKGTDGKYVIPAEKKNPFYVVGMPGIGKTEMVRQVADELGIGFYATSLTHHTRNSLLGLPVISSVGEYKSTEYTMPDILAQIEKKCEAGENEGLILIDEFASMSESLVAPMLAFLQNKSIGNHRLPEGWIMVLCSNPPEYNETAREFDAAVMDRVRYMSVTYSLEDFILYAKSVGIHETIIDFIQQKHGRAYRCTNKKSGDDSEIVTARSWENLSQCIYGYEDIGADISLQLIYQFIKSKSLAEEYFRYYSICKSSFGNRDFESIMSGRNIEGYALKADEMKFDKKWQIVRIITEMLKRENEETRTKGCLYDYMSTLCMNWQLAPPDVDRFKLIVPDTECYEALRIMASAEADNSNDYNAVNCIPIDEELKLPRRELILDLLREIDDSLDFSNRTNSSVMEKLSNIVDAENSGNNKRIAVNARHIGNVIRFVNRIDRGSLVPNFIREINKDRGILYTMVKVECPEYTDALGKVLGESA